MPARGGCGAYSEVGLQLPRQLRGAPFERALSILANLLVHPSGDMLAQCDPFGIPSTSHWTGAAIIVQ